MTPYFRIMTSHDSSALYKIGQESTEQKAHAETTPAMKLFIERFDMYKYPNLMMN